MALLKLSAPWQIYYKELNELFKQDDEVTLIYNTDDQVISIYVKNEAKADAMAAVLPVSLNFGNVDLKIDVIPANKCNNRRSKGNTMEDLFYGNQAVNKIITLDEIMSNPITYVVFKKEVVQYFNDDLGDAYGFCSTLYQDLAKRVLDVPDGIYFCTDKGCNTESVVWTYNPATTITSTNCTCTY